MCLCQLPTQHTEIYKDAGSEVANSSPDCSKNFVEMVENDSLEIAIIAKFR